MTTATPKQALLAHFAEHHAGRPLTKSMTLAQLQAYHANTHHRFATSHIHAGANSGPDQRPEGWKTGADVVLKREGLSY